MLRWGKEQANLTWSIFRLMTVTSGKYVGRMKLEIVHLQDKSKSVSVKKTTRCDNTWCLDVGACPENKNTCVVHGYQYYRLLCPPTQERFYCYKVHNKLLKVSKKFWYFLNLLLLTQIYFLFNINTKKKICHTNPTPTVPLVIVSWHKWHQFSLRNVGLWTQGSIKLTGSALGITMLSNSSVSEHIKIRFSRHSNLNNTLLLRMSPRNTKRWIYRYVLRNSKSYHCISYKKCIFTCGQKQCNC